MDTRVQANLVDVGTQSGHPCLESEVDSLRQLYSIVAERELTTLYQPIVDLHGCTVIGYEGLIRGPSDTPLHSPLKLLRLAHEVGLGFELETLCAEMLVKQFLAARLPGKLFINFSPDVLLKHSLRSEHSNQPDGWFDGIEPQRIVIELTEHGFSSTFGLDMMLETAKSYSALGFEVAIDDLGEGSSNLRLWSELRPDYIKIDRHFVQNIDKDPVKAQFVRSIQEISKNAGSKVIAEGIETRAELASVEEMGISIGQGYFIGRPMTHPNAVISAEVVEVIGQASDHGHHRHNEGNATEIERTLLLRVPAVSPETSNEEVFQRFENDPSLIVVPVVDKEGLPLGLINRYRLIESFARPFYHELYGKKPCKVLMDDQPLIVDKRQSVQELGSILADAEAHQVLNGFLITDEGRYLGIGSTQDLLRVITDLQISAARQANPLTQLPGNVPINETIDRWLKEGQAFAVCYFDLDHFKPFNDVYGFVRGDDILRMTGQIMTQVADGEQDFIGHIGGDDFIALFRCEDWKQRCEMALAKFGEGVVDFFSGDDLARGGYMAENRRGEMEFHPITTLSIGADWVEPGMFTSRLEIARVATETKKKAKTIVGNSLFVNQRLYVVLDNMLDNGRDNNQSDELSSAPVAEEDAAFA